MVEDINNSVLAVIGKAFAWLFAPLGFGFWAAAVAVITGLIAKENIVATFGVIYGFAEVAEDGVEYWGQLATDMGATAALAALAGFSFLVFNLLCAPCFAAMGAIKREMNNGKWTAFAITYQCAFAYAVSLCIYQIGSAILGQPNVFGLIVSALIIAFAIFMLVKPYKEATHLTKKIKIKK
jgi:ferrous iron transport protein B